jgi:signal transduction histidine kinase/ligand-binding sensor domain-containing protein
MDRLNMRNLIRYLSWLVGFVLFTTQAAAAVEPERIRFQRLSLVDGLSQVTVRAITQDSRGFMWFGTQDGLNRFDGYRFRSFYSEAERAHSLSDNHILVLKADHKRHGIWVGTQSRGLNFFDIRSEKFDVVPTGSVAGSLASANGVYAIAIANDGTVWAASADFIERYDPEQKKVLERIEISGINALALDAKNRPILGARSGIYTEQNGQMARLGGKDWTYGAVTTLLRDVKGRLWVGLQQGGLLRYTSAGAFEQHFRAGEAENTLPSDEILSLLQLKNGEIWVGSMAGTAVFAPGKDAVVRFQHDDADVNSIPANRVPALFEDRSGSLWVGSWTAGIALHHPPTRAIAIVRKQQRPNSLPSSTVRCIWRDSDDTLWLGLMEGGGLVHFDPKKGVLARFVHDVKNPTSLSHNQVQRILRARSGKLLIATMGGGLNELQSNGSFQRVPGLRSKLIGSVFEDQDGTLWVGTDDIGVQFRCPNCTAFEPLISPDGLALPNVINSITRSRDGTLWIASQGQGLVAFNASQQIVRFRKKDGDPASLSHDSVTSIFEASDGALWLGTQGGGLNQVKRTSAGLVQSDNVSFSAIRKRDGLIADAIGAIQEDKSGKLWISTTAGISAYRPGSDRASSLTESEGVNQSGYYIGSTERDPDGSILFGGLTGLTRFDPTALKPPTQSPNVELSGLHLFNVPVKLAWQDSTAPIAENIGWLEQLTLTHAQSMFSLEFSTLDFGYLQAARYQFRLLGQSDSWIDTTPGLNIATFTQLPPGNYTLQVRAQLLSQLSNQGFGPIRQLKIAIKPPLWRSNAAYLLYAALSTMLLLSIFRWRQRAWSDRNAQLARVAESETSLKNALWGSRDELWALDLRSGTMESINPLPQLLRHGNFKLRNLDDIAEIAHPEDRERLRLALHAHIIEGTDYYEAAFRMRTTDDDWAWVMSRGRTILFDEAGKAVKLSGTLRDISDVKAVEDELRRVNESLEHRVDVRTADLLDSNKELNRTLDQLKQTQRQLVASEKMASLGNLVAGVAHEINTPLGIGVTAASHLRSESERLLRNLEANRLSKSDLQEFAGVAVESSDLVLKNLDRASKLVRSFKLVAVDQSSEERRLVPMRAYIEEVVFTLKPRLKRTQHQLRVTGSPDIVLQTYPGSVSQIFLNLITNSLTHAFGDHEEGTIEIEITETPAAVVIYYSDSGVGMEESVRDRVFEPFFTTKRGQGGSGLGMHIVYNVVTQLMRGEISCESTPGKGVRFTITLPKI